MKRIEYYCNVNGYSADKLYQIRLHIEDLDPSGRMHYHGDVVYRVVNGVTDERWSRTINIVHGKVLFRRGFYPIFG